MQCQGLQRDTSCFFDSLTNNAGSANNYFNTERPGTGLAPLRPSGGTFIDLTEGAGCEDLQEWELPATR